MNLLRRLFGDESPPDLAGALEPGEHVVSSAAVESGGVVAVTALGLWVPGPDGVRRIGWHLVDKVVWKLGVLAVTEAEEVGRAGAAVVLADRPPARFVLPRPGALPKHVRQRVDGSIRGRYRKELPGGGGWFVLRKVPGRDGVVLQVRPDPEADPEPLAEMAREAAARLVDTAE
ncbi:hypothetical protein SAMN05421810_104193 [Amycolatopsis arida]|uniref:Uncharacterized protein n=1 Tax=Amycolatopsis arida TaxID=587909 RepID=A0A1I5V1F9_9PSEU|nr:hypothetical protein [Amycolatopsis arida]TDX91112.1 hypothetical protein CLV69_106192 [Amycolatopsis arida]SFQ01330.1 hypothetical protein SAMN05421810_104193 [Amycolatopsis arida]